MKTLIFVIFYCSCRPFLGDADGMSVPQTRNHQTASPNDCSDIFVRGLRNTTLPRGVLEKHFIVYIGRVSCFGDATEMLLYRKEVLWISLGGLKEYVAYRGQFIRRSLFYIRENALL
jgi:hypothetical protein